jgi:hypothetical protein
VRTELDRDSFQILEREIQTDVIRGQVVEDLGRDDELELGELPGRPEDRPPWTERGRAVSPLLVDILV